MSEFILVKLFSLTLYAAQFVKVVVFLVMWHGGLFPLFPPTFAFCFLFNFQAAQERNFSVVVVL